MKLCSGGGVELGALVALLMVVNQMATTRVEARNDNLDCGKGTSFDVPQSSARIYNGFDAKPGQVPYQVFLRIMKQNGQISRCGGVIVSERIILTAAHCVVDKCDQSKPITVELSKINVTIGELDVTKADGEKRVAIVSVVPNTEYCHGPDPQERHLMADIAGIKTKEPMEFKLTENGYGSVNKICLPTPDADYRPGDQVFVSGWGRVSNKKLSNTLRIGVTEIVEKKKCRKNRNDLKRDNICTSAESRGSCKGDSGGPVFRIPQQGGLAELVSLVSKGSTECGGDRQPSITIRITNHLDWIYDLMTEKPSSTSSSHSKGSFRAQCTGLGARLPDNRAQGRDKRSSP